MGADMAAPKGIVKSTPSPTKPAAKIATPTVNKATGFTTGKTAIVAPKKGTMVTTGKARTGATQSATAKGNSVFDQVGGFLQNRVDQMTGKIASPISGAMKNPTPVIPYTQKNVQAIQKATKRP